MADYCELKGHDFVRTEDGRNTCQRCGRWFDDDCRELEELRINMIRGLAGLLSSFGVSDRNIERLVEYGKMEELPALPSSCKTGEPPALFSSSLRPYCLKERRRAYRRKKKRQARRARRR